MDYYVYVHKKKTTGEVFYIGKGCGRRAWEFSGRSKYWKSINKAHGCIVEIHTKNVQEWYALEIEQNLIATYGRRIDNTGTLCNITTGGESQSGEANARYDHNTWTFYNTETKEELVSTRQSFLKLYPEVHVNLLFSEKSYSQMSKGWIVKEKVSEEYLIALSNGFRGEYSPRADKKVYSFISIDTLQILDGTRYDLLAINPEVNVNQIISKAKKTSRRWALLETYLQFGGDKLRNPFSGNNHHITDKELYSFTNLNTGEVIECTRYTLESKIGKQVACLFKEKPSATVGDWCLTKNVEMAKQISRNDYTKYKITNKDGREFFGTRMEFKNLTGLCPSPLFNKRSLKTYKGWSLCPEKPE
ncbi:MAG: hypothetical protein ABFD50_07165 [Smithella sp.]